MTRALYPLHSSNARPYTVRAFGMVSVPVTNEQRETIERIALDIFTDMSNAGAPFQQTLAAIYLSGLKHAIELEK